MTRHLRPDRARARRKGALFRLRGQIGRLHEQMNQLPESERRRADDYTRRINRALTEIATLEKRVGVGPVTA